MDKTTILYLDDDDAILELFFDLFGAEFDVRTALTPAEARGLLRERPADIVISDQSMPEIEGTEFLREVMEAYPRSVRVMVTGAAGVGGMAGEIAGGLIQLFVSKPWDEGGMRPALERAQILLSAG